MENEITTHKDLIRRLELESLDDSVIDDDEIEYIKQLMADSARMMQSLYDAAISSQNEALEANNLFLTSRRFNETLQEQIKSAKQTTVNNIMRSCLDYIDDE